MYRPHQHLSGLAVDCDHSSAAGHDQEDGVHSLSLTTVPCIEPESIPTMPLFSPSKDFTSSASTHYPSASPASSHPASFFFRRRTGKLNWSQLSSVSLASIIQHVDVDLLQQHVDTITYADITESDLSHATDPQILHLIRLCQLTVEYLLNAQNYLIKQAKRRDRLMGDVKAEVERCKQQLQQKDDEIQRLKQDNKYHKRLLKALEANHLSPTKLNPTLPSAAAAVGLGGGAELSVYTCEFCRASFVSEVYLQGHIGRRHPDARTRRGGIGKGKDGTDEDDREREKEKERERRVREKIEEEDRGRRELQRLRDELEADRKRMKEEMEREKAELLKAGEREREKQQAEWRQQQRKRQQDEEEKEQHNDNNDNNGRQPHHTNSRPAPILVTPPPQQPTGLAAEMERVAAEMRQLKEWKDGVMRGDISISPQPHSANNAQPATHRPQQQQQRQSTPTLSLSPASPVPSPSGRSSSQQASLQQPRLSSSHRLKRYSSFSSFPQLLSHFQHSEHDLVRAADGLEAAMDGWTEAEAERKEEELRAASGGYEREVAGVEGEVERLMDGFVNEALEERWAAVMEKERELDTRRRQREERARERDAATRRAMDRLAAERHAMEQADADRQQREMIDVVERERELQRVEHERQVMVAQQAQLVAAEQLAAHQQLLAHQAAQLSLYSQPTPPQPIIQQQQQPSMDEQRFLLEKQSALRAAQQQQQQQQLPFAAQSAALANAAATVAQQRRGALAPAYNAVEEISDIDSDDNSPLPVHQPQQQQQQHYKAADEHKQSSPSGGLLSPPQPRYHDSDEIESISLSQPVSPIPHMDDSTVTEQRSMSLSSPTKPVQLNAVRRVGGGFMLPSVTAKPVAGMSGGGGGLASGPRPNSLLKPIDQTRSVVRDLSADLDLDEEEF